MTPALNRLVEKILASNRPVTVEQIVALASDLGHTHLRKQDLIAFLTRARCNHWVEQVPIPGRTELGWTLTLKRKQKLGLVESPLEPPEPEPEDHPLFETLYDWQKQAVCAWEARNHRGIVEAVTGSGKTMVALAGWERLKGKQRPLHTLVVVPTIELMNQWCDRFTSVFRGQAMGRIGGGHHDDFSRFNICVSVINSAVLKLRELFSHLDRCPAKTLLVADECHRYIDPQVFSRIRRFPFTFTLGLSATIDPFQVAGLGQVVCTYRFGDAVRDGLVPRFDLLNVSVPLTGSESQDYKNLTETFIEQLDLVKEVYREELRGVPDTQLFRKLQSMLQQPSWENDPLIRRLFGLLFRRVSISYKAEHKMALAREILLLLLNEGRRKVLVFFERVQSASNVQEDVGQAETLELETASTLAESVTQSGVNWCKVLHSGLAKQERRTLLEEFRNTKIAALLACRVLDEGLDVPEIDAAVLVASTQSERQRIQRIGRALRRGDGKKRPLIVTLYVPETTDRGVVANDRELFADAATFHSADLDSCVRKLRMLLGLPLTRGIK